MELTPILDRLVLTELELDAHGYPEHQVRAATRYASRRALGIAGKARPELREAVFLASLEENLEAAERWLDGNRQASRDGDQRRGVDRASAEGLPERGYARLGVDGRGAAGAWRRATPKLKQAYDRFWSEEAT